MKNNVAGKIDRAIALYRTGDLQRAEKIYKKILKHDADNHNVLRLLGMLKNQRGNRRAAKKLIKKAIAINSSVPAYYNNLGEIYRVGQEYSKAIVSYRKAISLNARYAQAYNNMGCALQEINRGEDAVDSFKLAIQNSKNYAAAYNNLGAAYQQLGQLKSAVRSYEMAIQIQPDYAEAHHHLSAIKKYKQGDLQINIMEELFKRSEADDFNRMHLCFALAKAYDDLEQYDESFNCLEKGNRLRSKRLNYNIDSDRKMIAKIKKIFSARSPVLDIKSDGNGSLEPFFVVGMMRSGTSLVEQILASHSSVYGAGELETMGKLAKPMLSIFTDHNISLDQVNLFHNMINRVHDDYLDALSELTTSERIITDKMPVNFLWIGFILSAFPDAKIIHLKRDPVATCWSIYKHYFSGGGNGYAYDMGDLAEFYKLYVGLMSFWRKQFSSNIYDISYESLTENQEEESRRLLEFCGLEWEERCLDFHKTKRAVKTASAEQVRKKMYKGSSEAWKKYEKHLYPLISNLGY